MFNKTKALVILAALSAATAAAAQSVGETPAPAPEALDSGAPAVTAPAAEAPAPAAPEAETPAPATTEPSAPDAVATPGAPDAVMTPGAPAAGLPEGQTAPDPSSDPATGVPAASADAAQPGETYLSESFGDWTMRCILTEDGNDPCQLYQLLQDEEGNNVAEISLFGLPPGGEAAAGATIVTPLETLLTEQLTLQVDGAQARRYPFSFCSTIGCFARVGFTDEEVTQFKRGRVAGLSIVPAAAPDQRVNLDVSLSGFTAGYDAVNAANADN